MGVFGGLDGVGWGEWEEMKDDELGGETREIGRDLAWRS